MADLPDYQKQMFEFLVGTKIANHQPACSIIMTPRSAGKSWAHKFAMARSPKMQVQKQMQDNIQKAKQGATIHVTTDQDAEHWSDMAQEEYGRGDIIFRSGQSGKSWRAGRPYRTTSLFKPADIDVNKFDPSRNAIDAAIKKAQEEMRNVAFGHTESATAAVSPPGSPLMKPIDVAPQDGREVMLYCPNESPSHVAAKYVKAYDKDGGGWEGWMYADPILADIDPEGPQGATHFYELPTPETRTAHFTGGAITADMVKKISDHQADAFARTMNGEFVVPKRKVDQVFQREMREARIGMAPPVTGTWRGVPMENYEDDRFTIEQLVEMKDRGVDPAQVQTTIRTIHSIKIDPVSALRPNDPNAMVQKINCTNDVICPVVDFDHAAGFNGHCTVILPDGQCQRLNTIPKLL